MSKVDIADSMGNPMSPVQDASPPMPTTADDHKPSGRKSGNKPTSSRQAPTDSPKAAARRKRDMRVVSQMVCIYCAGNHDKASQILTAHCGEPLCSECAEIDRYAVERTRNCRNIGTETKVSCEECPNHCYSKAERAKIREVMRYAGPRMMKKHPISAIRHLLGK